MRNANVQNVKLSRELWKDSTTCDHLVYSNTRTVPLADSMYLCKVLSLSLLPLTTTVPVSTSSSPLSFYGLVGA